MARGSVSLAVVGDRFGLARSVILRAIDEDDGRGLAPIHRPTERLPEVWLDELSSDPVVARSRESDRLIVVRSPSMKESRRARAAGDTAGPDVLPLAATPAGPLSRRVSPRRSAGLAELLLAAGFCGFGAGRRASRRATEARGSGARHDLDTDDTVPFPRSRGRG
jgi:hypothetical protein